VTDIVLHLYEYKSLHSAVSDLLYFALFSLKGHGAYVFRSREYVVGAIVTPRGNIGKPKEIVLVCYCSA
jgi:hypothetical protein